MGAIEERVATLEGRVEEQARVTDSLRDAIVSVDRRLQLFEERVQAFEERVDRRFEQVDRRFEQIDRRFEQVDHRIDLLDAKVSRQFVWLVGLQVTSLIAIVGALGGVMAALFSR